MKKLLLLLFIIMSLNLSAQETKESIEYDTQFFTDLSCSQLNKKVKNSKKFRSKTLKELADKMLKNDYHTEYRIAEYEAYLSPDEIGRRLKFGNGFSQYENITGIYLSRGENIILVSDTFGKDIELLVPDLIRQPAEGIDPTKDPNGWGLKKEIFKLKSGVNIVNVSKGGNAYIRYFDNDALTAPKIKIHFPLAKVNGYFDISKHNNADWDRLLENSVSPIMDAKGKYIQFAYPIEWLRIFTASKGVELINAYDTMLAHQYTLMGLVKYNKVPKNRILARVNYNYYMFRDGDGVAYLGNKSTMRMVMDPSVVVSGDPCWGFCHEVGHVLQMRPQMTWGGMTEVSNNIYSLYTSAALGNESRIEKQNNYEKARSSIIGKNISYLHDSDVFNRLVPFWQLHLYFSNLGKVDFYADVMEIMRNREDAGSGNNSIKNQFEFIKICCDVAQLDLTDFFEKWGFFWVGEIKLDDYAKYHFNITKEMVEDTKNYIASKKYVKPGEDITLIGTSIN